MNVCDRKFEFNYRTFKTADIPYEHTVIRGKPCPNFLSPEVVLKLKEFEFRDGDVVVGSYQKSGSIILRVMLHLFFGLDPYDDHFHWMEVDGNTVKESAHVAGRRLFRTHLPLSWLPNSTGKDVTYLFVYPYEESFPLSLYGSAAFEKTNFEGDWDVFYRLWMEDKLFYGSFYEHLEAWLSDTRRNVWVWMLKNDAVDMTTVIAAYDKVMGKCETASSKKAKAVEKATAFLKEQNPMVIWKTSLEKKLLEKGLLGLPATQRDKIMEKRNKYQKYF